MKVVGANDNLRLSVSDAFDLVSPLAGRLDCSFHRLSAGIHRQRHFESSEIMQLLVEEAKLVVAEGTRCQRDLMRLVDQRLQDLRMAVPLVYSRVRCKTIQILLAVHVVYPHTLRTVDDDVER